MASAQPSEEDVAMFLAVTNTSDRIKAVQFLKGSGDVESAVGQYYDSPNRYGSTVSGWDESAFTDESWGVTHREHAFQIDATSVNHSTAPTRPPSPANSAHSMQVHPDSTSQGTLGPYGPQESGVILTERPQFGPANREHYEPSQWALTVSGPTVVDVVPDVEPASRRKWVSGKPTFFKPLPGGDRLPNLITILASLPALHQSLYSLPLTCEDYGYDNEWWTGTPISISAPTEAGADESIGLNEAFIFELHRLLAFMVATRRSYGSVEALVKSKAFQKAKILLSAAQDTYTGTEQNISGTNASDSLVKTFLSAYTAVLDKVAPGDEANWILHSSIVQGGTPDGSERRIGIFEIKRPSLVNGLQQSLYDGFDDYFWSKDPDGESAEFVDALTAPANILIVQIKAQTNLYGASSKVAIPASLSLDRYSSQNMDMAMSMRRSRAAHRSDIARVDQELERIKTFSSFDKRLDAMSVLSSVINALGGKTAKEGSKEESENPANSSDLRFVEDDAEEDFETIFDSPLHSRGEHHIVQQLEGIYESIQTKLAELNEEKNHIQKRIDELSRMFIREDGQDGTEETTGEYNYHLRGVATDGQTTYVLDPHEAFGPSEASDLDMETDRSPAVEGEEKPAREPKPQWWRIHYAFRESASVRKERVTEQRVLEAASNAPDPILVYYTDNPSSTYSLGESLPEALRRFIELDNEAFSEEVRQENLSYMPGPPPDDPPPYDDDKGFATDDGQLDDAAFARASQAIGLDGDEDVQMRELADFPSKGEEAAST